MSPHFSPPLLDNPKFTNNRPFDFVYFGIDLDLFISPSNLVRPIFVSQNYKNSLVVDHILPLSIYPHKNWMFIVCSPIAVGQQRQILTAVSRTKWRERESGKANIKYQRLLQFRKYFSRSQRPLRLSTKLLLAATASHASTLHEPILFNLITLLIPVFASLCLSLPLCTIDTNPGPRSPTTLQPSAANISKQAESKKPFGKLSPRLTGHYRRFRRLISIQLKQPSKINNNSPQNSGV